MAITKDDILKLTVSERLELLDTIWESIATDSADLPLTEGQRREIDRRFASSAVTSPPLKTLETVREPLTSLVGNGVVSSSTYDRDGELIAKHIGDEFELNGRRADAYLKQSRVSIWAIVGYLGVYDGNIDEVARMYDLSEEEMAAALAYYRRNKKYVDARLLLNES
jgi:putative addiction module component (TIGR02574 family)